MGRRRGSTDGTQPLPSGVKAFRPCRPGLEGPKNKSNYEVCGRAIPSKGGPDKERAWFSEKNPRALIGRELLHANVSPSMLISRSLAL